MSQDRIKIYSAISFADIEKVILLHETIWGLEQLEITPSHIYKATNNSGGHTLIATVNDNPVGYVYGFPGIDTNHETYFYIHNIGVLATYRSLGIGMQLMLEIRKILLNDGYSLVKWTYDPLETLNASLYIGKLGSLTNDYVENYYGEMNDKINKGLPSDRLNLYWYIRSAHVIEKLNNKKPLPVFNKELCLNAINKNDAPEDISIKQNKQLYYIQSPANFHRLKQQSENKVYQWRMNVRKNMQRVFSEGLYLTDTIYTENKFFYLLTPSPLKN